MWIGRIGWPLLLVAGCRISLDSDIRPVTTAQMCEDLDAPKCTGVGPTLASIQENVFTGNCAIAGCHDGMSKPAGVLDLRDGMAYAHLVDVASMLEPTRRLVVPGDPAASYLEVMIGKIQPEDAKPPAGPIRSDVGLMPQDNAGKPLCCQKLDAIDAWIAGGAMP